MKTKKLYKKRWFLSVAALVASFSISALTISCSSSEEVSDNVAQGNWTLFSKAKIATSPWSFDSSISFGSPPEGTRGAVTINALQSQFIRRQVKKQPKIVLNAQKKPEYQAWSYESLKFDYANAVILTLNDGSRQVFDSDEAEIEETGSKDNPVVVAKSANAKSINSQAFIDALKKTKKLQVRIRPGTFYTDSKGKKTAYEIKAEDFWASYWRSYLLTTDVRLANGGSEELDKKGVSLNPARNRFTKDSRYSNDYLYGLFGIDVNKLLDEKTGLEEDQDNPGSKLITWTAFEGGESPDFLGMFSKQVVDTTEFSPVSQEYIAKLNENAKYQDFSSASGKAKRFGVYTYGRDWEDILYSGYFYISDVNVTKETVRYVFNPNHAHAEENKKEEGYVKSLNFIALGTNADQRLATEFQLGNIYDIPDLGGLADKEKKEVQKFLQNDKNERFSLSLERQRINQGGYVLTNPSPAKNVDDYLFNDNLSKLVYGVDRQALKTGTKPTNFFSAKSIAFRNAIFAAVNWQQVARQLNDDFAAYLGHVAPDASIGGKNDSSASFKTLRSKIDELNTRQVFSFNATNNTLIRATNPAADTLSNDKNNEAIIKANSADVDKQYRSAAYELAKKEIKKIIDAENLAPGQKLEWTWVDPDRTKATPRQIVALEKLYATINSLDDRLDIKSTIEENQADFDKVARNGLGYLVVGGWSYDYDGLGTGLDGLVHRERSTFLPYFSRALDTEWIKTQFPKTHELAKELEEFVKELNKNRESFQTQSILVDKTKPIVSVSDWKDQENHFWSNDATKAINADEFSLMGNFFASYQKNHTNEELLAVLKELIEVINFVPGRNLRNSILQKLKPNLQAVNKGRILPVSTSGILYIADLKVKKS